MGGIGNVIPFFLCTSESKRIWCPTPTLQSSTMLIFGCVHRGAIFHCFALRRLELCAFIKEWDLQRRRSSGAVRFWMWCRECYLNSCIIRRDILLFLLPNPRCQMLAPAARAQTDDSSCGPEGHGCLLSAKVPSRHCYKQCESSAEPLSPWDARQYYAYTGIRTYRWMNYYARSLLFLPVPC